MFLTHLCNSPMTLTKPGSSSVEKRTMSMWLLWMPIAIYPGIDAEDFVTACSPTKLVDQPRGARGRDSTCLAEARERKLFVETRYLDLRIAFIGPGLQDGMEVMLDPRQDLRVSPEHSDDAQICVAHMIYPSDHPLNGCRHIYPGEWRSGEGNCPGAFENPLEMCLGAEPRHHKSLFLVAAGR